MSGRSAVIIKVPLWRTLGASLRLVLGRPVAFARIAWLPYALFVATELGFYAAASNGFYGIGRIAPLGSWVDAVLVSVIYLLAVIIQVACCSVFLLRWQQFALREDRAGVSPPLWAGVWRLSMYGIAITLIVGVFVGATSTARKYIKMMDFGIAPTIWTWVLFFLVSIGVVTLPLIIARLSLILPAAAFGHPLGISAAWRCTRGSTWRLAVIYVLFTLLFGCADIAAEDFLTNEPLAGIILTHGLFFILLALIGATAALSYRLLVLPRRADLAEVFD